MTTSHPGCHTSLSPCRMASVCAAKRPLPCPGDPMSSRSSPTRTGCLSVSYPIRMDIRTVWAAVGDFRVSVRHDPPSAYLLYGTAPPRNEQRLAGTRKSRIRFFLFSSPLTQLLRQIWLGDEIYKSHEGRRRQGHVTRREAGRAPTGYCPVLYCTGMLVNAQCRIRSAFLPYALLSLRYQPASAIHAHAVCHLGQCLVP